MRTSQAAMLLFAGVTCASAWGAQDQPPSSSQKEARTPAPGHWPQWHGPNRDNVSTETGLLKEWPQGGPRLLWKATGIGDGVSPVSVAGGLVFVLGVREGTEYVTALDGGGRLVWSQPIGPSAPEFALMRIVSQRAPTVDDDRLYAFKHTGVLYCLRSSDGREVWKKDYVRELRGQTESFGFFDAPMVEGDALICTPGGPQGTVAALDKAAGHLLWQSSELTDRASHAAIVPAEIGGVRQYIVLTNKSVAGIAAKGGELLWRADRQGKTIVPAPPIYHDGMVFVTSGYGVGFSAFGVSKVGGRFEVEERYTGKQLDNQYVAAIRVGDYVYGPHRGGLKCIEFGSGKEIWEEQNAGIGPMACADGHLVLRNHKGPVTLLEATPEGYREKGRFVQPSQEQILSGKAWAWSYPVIAGGRLYLRDLDALFCYDLRDVDYREPAPVWNILARAPSKPPSPQPLPAPGSGHPSVAVFVPTPQDVVEKMLEAANLTKNDVVYDLGSGDGRIVIAASKKYGCKSVGYEIEPGLVKLSRSKAKEAEVDSLVSIEEKDLFTADLAAASVVTLYLGEPNNKRLLPQLQKLRGGVRIVSHAHRLGEAGPKPDSAFTMTSQEDGMEHTIYLWTTPLKPSQEGK